MYTDLKSPEDIDGGEPFKVRSNTDELAVAEDASLVLGRIGRGSLGPEIFGFLEEVLSRGSAARLPKLLIWSVLLLTERGLDARENHFLGAALVRNEVKDEVEGDDAGGKETFEMEGLTFGSTWSCCEFFLGLAGILAKHFHMCDALMLKKFQERVARLKKQTKRVSEQQGM